LEQLDPYQVGGGMVGKVTSEKFDYGEFPQKFEAGTPNIAGAVGLGAAVDYLENQGVEEIERHDKKLCKKIREGLGEIEGVDVISPEGSIITSFTMDYAHPHDVAEILNQNNVAVRAGHHCAQPQMEEMGINGTVRASPYLYNTEEEIEMFLEAVRKVRKVFE
jgi:cysteine desulfurase/selenocysteine lyase